MGQTLKTPGVYTFEKDVSEVVAPAGTSIGAMVIESRKGPANRRVLINRDKELVTTFGIPKAVTDPSDLNFYAGLEFLKESDSLYVVRATSGTEAYSNIFVSGAGFDTATSKTITEKSTTLLLATDGYDDGNGLDDIQAFEGFTDWTGNALVIGSNFPGTDGDLIGVIVNTISGSTVSTLSADYDWAGKYDTSVANKIVKISVFVKDSADDTDFPSTAAETWYVAMDYLKDPAGNQLYAPTVINGKSQYIYVKVNSGSLVNTLPGLVHTLGEPVALSGGADSDTNFSVSTASKNSAWSLYSDKDKVEVSILIGAYKGTISQTIAPTMQTIAGTRQDCIAVVQVDIPTDKTVTAVKASAASVTTNSYPSYVAKYFGWDKYYDGFNDRQVYVPRAMAGSIAMARTDSVAKTWNAPAGFNRGGISYSQGANKVWSDTEIGLLYDINLNGAKKAPDGFYIWGQKTAQLKKSALDRINVRRLMIYIEKSISKSMLPFVFEPNDDTTRLRVKSIIDGFLDTIGTSGLTRYSTVVDTTNNTSQVIDNNELVVDCYLQPAKSIEFIRLQYTISRTGVSLTQS
jgi:phage tail sheath protein FI